MTLGIGVLGLGSVFSGPYLRQIETLSHQGRVRLVAGYDELADKRSAVAASLGLDTSPQSAEELIARPDVDVVLVLTSMNPHGRLAAAALAAGKHTLVEKPMATNPTEAAELIEAADGPDAPVLVCAPHVVLSPTYRELHDRVHQGVIGPVYSARARYGWAGPWWGAWFYEPGGGALFDLGVYNLTSLCGLLGPVRRVAAMVGVAIEERRAEGHLIDVTADDNAQVLLDFGHSTFAVITTGFTMQKYRSPAIELYGRDGVLQLLGDDWAPEGFEQWSNDRGTWEVFPESAPTWPWTDGLRHLIDCVETGRRPLNTPRHAFHALEVMLAAKESARSARFVEVTSDFPAIAYDEWPDGGLVDARRKHDPRS